MLVVSSVIGAGIFFTPSVVAENVPDPTLILFVWVLGGGLSLAGALANAELGAMYPHAGGNYVYLREAFHPAAGFLVGWLSFFVIYAGTIATLAAAFAEGLANFFLLGEGEQIAIAIGVTALTSWVNYAGLRAGATVNNVTAVLKMATLGLFVVIGWIVAPARAASPAEVSSTVTLAGIGLAMSPILFSYLGWNAPVFVASEIKRPARNLPWALFIGLAICTALYLLLNALYLRALPLSELASQARSGEAAAVALFGPVGGSIAALLILVSVLGCLNATILVGPRIAYAMALDGRFLPAAEGVHESHHTPHVAIAVQALFAVVLILLLRQFPSVLNYTTFAIVLATMADVAALYALRRKWPDLPRPYRAWGYPWMPALYFLANAAIAAALLWRESFECVVALAVTASGLPFLWLFERRERSRSRPAV